MKTQSQILLIALAIAFTVVLALAVALICLSVMQESAEDRRQAEESAEEGSDGTTAETVPVFSGEETTALPEPDGLLYVRAGDGTCAVSGIGSCTDTVVVIPETSPAGDRVVRIAERAFMGCGSITAVHIPASVREIGELAFADCPNLVYLSVQAQNRYYCDLEGVLYTKDRHTLIQYPARRAGAVATVSREVTAICEMAFYRCVYLSEVRYEGTAEEWERIRVAPRNYSLTAAAVVYNGW